MTAANTPLENIKYVAAGNFSSYAISADGKVYSWGSNIYGQLGNGQYGGNEIENNGYDSDVVYATEISIDADGNDFSNIIKIAAGISHVLALKNDGSLYVWGTNGDSLLVSNSSEDVLPLPSKMELSVDGQVLDVAAGGGTNSSGSSGDEGKQQLRFHSMILTSAGSVYVWGHNEENTLGKDDNNNSGEIEKLESIKNIVSINAARYNSSAITSDGKVYTWGRNDEGQIGNLNVALRTNEPMNVMAGATNSEDEERLLENIVAIAIGANHMTALRLDGKVYSWGTDMFGQLGDGRNGYEYEKVDLPVLTGIASSNSLIMDHVKVVAADTDEIAGEYVGSEAMPEIITITDAQKVKIEIPEIKKYYKSGFNLIENDKKSDITSTIIFSTSNDKIAGVAADTVEKEWETVSPVSLENGGERGIVEIKAENEGFFGILKIHVKAPNEFTTPMIASGENFTVALKSDGSVWAWGDNTYGQLGNGNFESTQGPIPVLAVDGKKNLSGVFKIAAGKYHALAMTSDGAVLAWGLNDKGQLGNNSTTNQNVPVKVFGGEYSSVNGFITLANDIAAGGKHSLVALATGAVYAWGSNNHGQLGNTRDENDVTENSKELTPVRVIQGASSEDGSSAYIDSAVAVAAGENHSLVLLGPNTEVADMDRVVLTWGANNYGQMGSDIIVGDGEVSDEPSDNAWNQLVPTELSADGTIITNIGAIAAGKNHSVLLEYSADGTGGKVYTVGANEYGQLGRNSTSKYLSDVTPLSTSDVTDNVVDEKKDIITTVTGIAAGGNNTSIIDATGNVYNFGDNRRGQLGMGNVGGNKNVATINSDFLENGQAIAVGSQSGFVMKKDGYVWAFGYNSDGQLGDLSREDNSTPALVGSGAEDVLQLSVTVPTSDGGTKDIVNPNNITVNKNQSIKANGGNIISLRGFNLIVNDDEVKKATSINYSSSDDSVVSVSGTTFTAVSKGIAVIKAVSSTGVVGMFVVHVNDLSEDAFYTEPMVSAGENFSVALKSDGTVWTWGANENGQLGNGTKGKETSQYSPVQVVGVNGTSDSVLKNIVAISAGDTHVVALSANGEVYTWGGNMYGQLGNGTSGIESAIEGDEEEQHDAVEYNENTGYYTIYAAEGLEKVREVLDGKFILAKDITLSSSFAPIGNDEQPFTGIFDGNGYRINNVNISSAVIGTNIGDSKTSVSAMFAVNNGTIQNVILNSISVSNTTLEIEDNDMSVPAYSISAGLVGFNDGTVTNSGIVSGQISSYNLSGGLVAYNGEHGTVSNVYNRADVTVVNSETSVSIKYVGGITAVNLGNIFRVYSSGTISGTSDISGAAGIAASNMAESSVDAEAGVEYGVVYTYTNNGTVIGVGNEAASSSANADLTDSSVYTGWNFEDGSGVWSFINKYDENDKLPVLQIEQGPPAAPAETDYTTMDSSVPVTIVSDDGKEIGKISAVAAGGNHTLILSEDGYVYSFGSNGSGQLGVGNDGYDSTTSLAKYKKKAAKVLGGRSASSDIYLSNIVRIAAGKEFSAALKSNGMIVVWGNNEYGQLGINANGLRNQPVKVITRNSKNLENVIDISLGANHALALTFDNSLYAWGANDRRQLASNTKDIVSVPERITISGKIKTIAAGGQHSAIITALEGSENNTVWTWGDNEFGQLGIKDINSDISRNALPTRVDKGVTIDSTDNYLINVIGLSTGGSHTVVIKDDGYVYSWGLNASGQIGDISNETRRTPVLTGDREARVLMMQKINANPTSDTDKTVVRYDKDNPTKELKATYTKSGSASVPSTGNPSITLKKKPVTITVDNNGTDAINHTYSGNNSLTAEEINKLKFTTPDNFKVVGDDVTLSWDTISATIGNNANGNVADNLTINATGYVLSGTDADNYEISYVNNAKGNIVKAPLTITINSVPSINEGATELNKKLTRDVNYTVSGEVNDERVDANVNARYDDSNYTGGTADKNVTYSVTNEDAYPNYDITVTGSPKGSVTQKTAEVEIDHQPNFVTASPRPQHGDKLGTDGLNGFEYTVSYSDGTTTKHKYADGDWLTTGGYTAPEDGTAFTWENTSTAVSSDSEIRRDMGNKIKITVPTATNTPLTNKATADKKKVKITANGTYTKVYDGTNTVTLNETTPEITYTVSGVATGDTVTVTATPAFVDGNVAKFGDVYQKAINFTNVSIKNEDGTDTDNYEIVADENGVVIAPIMGAITPKTINITALTVPSSTKGSAGEKTVTKNKNFTTTDILEKDKDNVTIGYKATFVTSATGTVDATVTDAKVDGSNDQMTLNYVVGTVTGAKIEITSSNHGGGGGGGGGGNSLSIKYENADGTAGKDVSKIEAPAGSDPVDLIAVFTTKPKDPTVIWTSDNESVATVDENGIVKFIGEGTAIITAQSKTNKTLKDTVTVTVTKAVSTPTPKPAEPTPEPTKEPSIITKTMLNPYIVGYDDNVFGPELPISREEVSAIFARLIANNIYMDKEYDTSFPDVGEGWSKDYIGYLEKFSVVTGYEDGTFRPQNYITRAEMAVMMAKAEGYDISGYMSSDELAYPDVDEGYSEWAVKAIKYLTDRGIMEGYPDGTFGPNRPITRAETVATVNRVLADMTVGNIEVLPSDMTEAHWAYNDVVFAMNHRILKDVAADESQFIKSEEYDKNKITETEVVENTSDEKSGAGASPTPEPSPTPNA